MEEGAKAHSFSLELALFLKWKQGSNFLDPENEVLGFLDVRDWVHVSVVHLLIAFLFLLRPVVLKAAIVSS